MSVTHYARSDKTIVHGNLSVDQLLNMYCVMTYRQCGSYLGAAEKLGLDRRTVKKKIAPGA